MTHGTPVTATIHFRFRPQRQFKTMAEICEMDQRKNGGNFRKFPASIVWYFLLVLRAIFDCESSCFYGIEVGWPSKTLKKTQCLAVGSARLATTLKTYRLTFFTRDDIFGLEKLRFLTENQPMPKILHSWVSREWHDYYRVEFSTS